MFTEYQPDYYVNFNAENVRIHLASDGNHADAVRSAEGRVIDLPGKARLTLHETNYENTTAVRCVTEIENTGSAPLTVDTLSAAFVTDIDAGEWNKDRFILHYAHSAHFGEAQWQHVPLADMGLYPVSDHVASKAAVRFSSIGTWSTGRYEPFFLLEDTDLRKTWYFLMETGTSWYVEFTSRGTGADTTLCVFLSDSVERNDGWYRELAPGERYRTCPAAVGCVSGGFEEAVGDATKYRRASRQPDFPVPPLCFNDYMNCLWGYPSREKLLPLIAAAAKAGCEYFVIDAGWYGRRGDWNREVGDWVINERLFGEGGLVAILDAIRAAGMKPGLWLEIESASPDTPIAQCAPDALLRRHGSVIGNNRAFLNFNCEAVRRFLFGVFEKLYAMGVRYIKNDYNQTIGIGIDDKNGTVSADAMRREAAAALAFVDEIHAKYPDLVIENCGSGAMRSDPATLSHFALQSVTDQEDYLSMPSVVTGSLACIAPERLGVWAYPYPLPSKRRNDTLDASFALPFADGNETVFNMVTGLTGVPYLSGHIEYADETNLALIREATNFFKTYRGELSVCVPIYPTGTFPLTAKGIVTVGLLDRAAHRLFLAVWSLDDTREATLGLSRYAKGLTITDRYPARTDYLASVSGTDFTVKFPAPNCAVFTVLSLS